MKIAAKRIINLAFYSLAVFAVLSITLLVFPLEINLIELLLPISIFLFITAFSLLVFHIGTTKNQERQPLYTMGALGIKFFFSMVFALVYFIALKNTAPLYIILFFLLYLAFTIYLIRGIFKILKIKSLK